LSAFSLRSSCFRWEKDEKVRPASKLWLGRGHPAIFHSGSMGSSPWRCRSKRQILARQLARRDTYLIRGARIFIGDGKVIETAAS